MWGGGGVRWVGDRVGWGEVGVGSKQKTISERNVYSYWNN